MTDGPLSEGILFLDQYQLSMAQLYFREGLHERRVQFDYFFRRYPEYGRHQAGYCVFAGLEWLLDWMTDVRFGPAELEQMRRQEGAGGTRLFDDEFLGWLEADGNFSGIELRSISEGRVVHPLAPVAAAAGPLAMAQILETSLLNHLNYPTLIATKASRVRESGRGRPVLEFGMRRGPGKGVNAGARAALIGGADFTSNAGISHELGYPPQGTHAHSMVQVYVALGGGELEAFRAYAAAYPEDCVLLVDTIDTLESGIPNAIKVFEELRSAGHEPRGIRLDSGDLAYLAIQAARRLDDAGFDDVAIVMSSNLDELAIWQILSQIEDEAPRYGVDPAALTDRLVYGVGTRLISSQGHEALDGVYKLVAVSDNGSMTPSIKLSDSPEKVPIAGPKRVWRLCDGRGIATADLVADPGESLSEGQELEIYHPHRDGVSRRLGAHDVSSVEALLDIVFRDGRRVGKQPTIEDMRALRVADLDRLDPGVRRLVNPHVYHVSVTGAVHDRQWKLIADARRE